MTVYINKNYEWIETEPDKKLIFVIVPGAGTRINRNAYKKLETNFNLVYFGKSGGIYDKYPENWINNKFVSNKGNHLGGITQLVKKYIEENKIPSMIISGSRGSQVTIGKIWYSVWRGTTINFNAGCLTTNTIIPIGVKPIFITMGNDYFNNVNSISKTINLFRTLNKYNQPGLFIHLEKESHMPVLVNSLESFLLYLAKNDISKLKTIKNIDIKFVLRKF